MFCDELEIKVIAGKGGDGCVSFRREKFVAKGGPNGGDGGNGGNVIFKANPNLNTLSHLAGQKIYKAQKGENGKGKNMYGKTGEDLIIEVPPGTLIMNTERQMLADLTEKNEEFTVCYGGKGGLGNTKFKSSTRQVPRFAEKGEPGQELEVILELKLVAEIGIIGLPSAGKSTLISVISKAKPKIAAYHFTTLIPNLGVVDMTQFGGSAMQNFLTADIPGLIEGASEGKGLGHQFLRHISRTKVLIHLLDATEENLATHYKVINQELKQFDPGLAEKPQIIALNKIDQLTEEELTTKIKEIKKASKAKEVFTISAIQKTGLKELLFRAVEQLKEIAAQPEPEEPETIPIIKPELKRDHYELIEITKEEKKKVFHLTGPRLEQIMVMTDTGTQEGLERIYYYFNRTGIQKSVERAGAEFGDIIQIKGKRIPYRP